jgi:hypothetical protein
MTEMRAFRPHPELPWAVGAAAHRVVACAERTAGDDRELRHVRTGDGGHELGPVARDPTLLVLLADHEAGDVLQEDERDLAFRRQFDEVGALLGGLGEQHALVRQDRDGIALDPGEAADEGLAVERLELGEPAAVDDPCDQLVRVHLVLEVLGHEPVEVVRVERRWLRGRDVPGEVLAAVEVPDDLPGQGERVLVGRRVVVGDPGPACVHVRSAQLLGRHILARWQPSRAGGRR